MLEFEFVLLEWKLVVLGISYRIFIDLVKVVDMFYLIKRYNKVLSNVRCVMGN